MGETSDQLIVEDILAFDVSDDELEAAACRDDPRIFTLAFCSQDWNTAIPGEECDNNMRSCWRRVGLLLAPCVV